MNKAEKEVIQYQLNSEKAVLDELRKQYQRALNDIDLKIRILQSDELTQSKIYQLQYQKVLKKQVEAILEKLHADEYTTIQQFLTDSYTTGFVGTMYDMHSQGVPLILPIDQNAAVKAVLTDSKIKEGLYETLGVDVNRLKKSISGEITRGIASGLSYYDIARNISTATKAPYSRAKTIVRTEAHRIQQASAMDAQRLAKSKGADVVKQWDATMDGDTRPTHRELDGQIQEVDKPFEANGKKAMYPGDFGDPAEDCNCRCVSLTRARWALDKDELKTLQERAEYFGLDKTDSIKEFKDKYLTTTHMLATPGNPGEKAVPYSERGIEIEKRLQEYLKVLKANSDYIERPAGEFKKQDLAILTTETGVEYTSLTIGNKSYLIRGAEKYTSIPDELYDRLMENKGTLDCHSHPRIGDLRPSKEDQKFMKSLTWQEKSVIIDPTQDSVVFTEYGATEKHTLESESMAAYLSALVFGEGD